MGSQGLGNAGAGRAGDKKELHSKGRKEALEWDKTRGRPEIVREAGTGREEESRQREQPGSPSIDREGVGNTNRQQGVGKNGEKGGGTWL